MLAYHQRHTLSGGGGRRLSDGTQKTVGVSGRVITMRGKGAHVLPVANVLHLQNVRVDQSLLQISTFRELVHKSKETLERLLLLFGGLTPLDKGEEELEVGAVQLVPGVHGRDHSLDVRFGVLEE